MKFFIVFLALLFAKAAWAQENARAFFASGTVHKIEIQVQDWDQLRKANPAGGRCVWGYIGDQYEWFSAASISIDGQSFSNIGLKKKSWCGSESKTKPSLNVSLDRFQKKQEAAAKDLLGGATFTLNNSIQDPSYIRQCFAYSFFRKLGVPAPYCSFARLTVNGADLGLYVLLEAMKKPFLKRNFGPDLGNLYEVAGENFEDWALARFAGNMDNNSGDASLSELKRVIDALRDGSGSLTAIEEAVHLEKFLRFWTAEVLLMHWDGLTLGTNNSYLYFNSKGQMELIPWGTDQILYQSSPREAGQIYASNRLAQKLFAEPSVKGRLFASLRSILGKEWNEDHLKEKAAALAATVRPHLNDYEKGLLDYQLGMVQKHIKDRRGSILALIAEDNFQGFPYCQSASSDPDSDTWGWENNASCKVRGN